MKFLNSRRFLYHGFSSYWAFEKDDIFEGVHSNCNITLPFFKNILLSLFNHFNGFILTTIIFFESRPTFFHNHYEYIIIIKKRRDHRKVSNERRAYESVESRVDKRSFS